MKFRRFNKAYANSMGYFWLPCPLCGQFFGGHEWKTENGDAHSIPIEGRPNTRTGICPDCGYKREAEMKLNHLEQEDKMKVELLPDLELIKLYLEKVEKLTERERSVIVTFIEITCTTLKGNVK